MRQDESCPGAKSCPAANIYLCHDCGESFRSETDPDGCTACGGRGLETERCEKCPQRKLEAALGGGLGSLIQRSLQIEAALQLGFGMTLEDVTAEEFAAVALIKEERLKREAEQARQSGV